MNLQEEKNLLFKKGHSSKFTGVNQYETLHSNCQQINEEEYKNFDMIIRVEKYPGLSKDKFTRSKESAI